MKVETLLKTYYFKKTTTNIDSVVNVTVELIERSSNNIKGRATANIRIDIGDDIVTDTNLSNTHLIKFDWNKLIDNAERTALDYFFIRYGISDFFPQNNQTDLTKLYIH